MTLAVLNTDDPAATVEVDGRLVRNLTAEEYAATWAEGTPHPEHPAGLEQLAAEADRRSLLAPRSGGPMPWMPAYSYGGLFGAGMPLGVVVHCTESVNFSGSAEAIAGPGWFGGPSAGTSAHKVADRDSIVEGVHRNTVAWHVGPGGNGLYIGYEFCGMAEWTAAQWHAPENLAMLALAAPHIADDLQAFGAAPAWLSLAQIGARQRGLLTHNDVRLVWGGTTHSDPGPNFPYAELLAYVKAALGVPAAPKPVPVPAPIPPVPGLPAWPRPSATWTGNDRFGLITDPSADIHGGITAWERIYVLAAQRRLVAKGYAAGQRDWRSAWCDGKFGPETVAAVARFQHAELPRTTLFGQLWADDWARLAR